MSREVCSTLYHDAWEDVSEGYYQLRDYGGQVRSVRTSLVSHNHDPRLSRCLEAQVTGTRLMICSSYTYPPPEGRPQTNERYDPRPVKLAPSLAACDTS
jgi:hypothetical protein